MNATLSFEQTPLTHNISVSRANALFAAVAALLNNKLDRRDPSSFGILCNRKRVINVREGVADGDGVTLAQLLRAASSGEVTAVGEEPEYKDAYQPWVPIVVTADNFSEAIRENILNASKEMSNKVNIFEASPLMSDLTGNGQRLRLVGDAVHPKDLVNYRTALEVINGTTT